MVITAKSIYVSYQDKLLLDVSKDREHTTILTTDEKKLNAIFMKDGIPLWVAASAYVALAAIAIGVIPVLFPALKWYFVLLCYIVAPALAFLQCIWSRTD